MHRFTDIESTSKRLPPVYGYLTHQLVPLSKALEPISSLIDQLDRFAKIAKNECHFPSQHGLTRDESAAVYLYTMEWGENSFYQVLNRALRAEDRSALKPWFAYLKLFDVAVQKLPTVRKNLWRGVSKDITRNYKKGDEFTWWTISSCSTSVNIIKDFLGPNSTLFLIEAISGKDVSSCTNYPNEDEVILCPGTRFRVVSDPLDQPPMHLIHLQEITDDDEGSLSAGLKTMTVTTTSNTTSTHTLTNVQSSQIHIHTDEWGHRYETVNTSLANEHEGEMKGEKKHGKGQMDYANGGKYIGMWVEGNRIGQGVYIFNNGDRYEGQFKDNLVHGKGQMDFANGDKYTGDYIDDKRTGQGVYIYANGNRYEGEFKDNKRHGKGKMYFASGAKYTGDYIEGNRTGQGVYNFPSGDRYEGQWKDNDMHGKGKMDFASGDKYTGDYIDDKRTGQGVYMFANGNRYEGQYKDNKKHGKGKMIYANGVVQDGMWSDNKFDG
ncbi:unnamed protein product [Adineta steineri]|uniref:NAD(P)(+)--arginine ADP-ribosyltransferase n=1 Tax=Adineta steineri TaxID=433720 RepID=A0A815WV58_9BILA|nr:unnamed protein product [Adineta steineri]CAF1547936.1 unnamed protein product [Adineta steineri]